MCYNKWDTMSQTKIRGDINEKGKDRQNKTKHRKIFR